MDDVHLQHVDGTPTSLVPIKLYLSEYNLGALLLTWVNFNPNMDK